MNQPLSPAGGVSPAYDLLVFIGRFQPLHEGHEAVIREAMQKARHVAVLIGSAYRSRNLYNPFTFDERDRMIRSAVADPDGQIHIRPIMDEILDDDWKVNVQDAVADIIQDLRLETEDNAKALVARPKLRIGLIGHSKDGTSYYLRKFPQWASENVQNYMNQSATPIRNSYFSNIGSVYIKNLDGHRPGDKPQEHLVSTAVREFLSEFLPSPAYKMLRAEHDHAIAYRVQWANTPFPVNFVTTDAVVLWSGHVLLVERGSMPGKGLWALPGGHLKQSERVLDGMIRELIEETKIGVPEAVLRGCIEASYLYDEPMRSTRYRTLTHAFRINLRDSTKAPSLKGSDDATKAWWHPIGDVPSDMMMEDHYQIINHLRRL